MATVHENCVLNDGYARARLAAATSYNAQPIEVVPA
jgi:hypothetical protein